MLQAFVLVNRSGVGQVHRVASIHEPIHQPVPIIGGFYDEAMIAWLNRTEVKKNVRQVIGRSLLVHDLLLIITRTITLLLAWRSMSPYTLVMAPPWVGTVERFLTGLSTVLPQRGAF